MSTAPPARRVLAASDRLYRRLLVLYPRRFRQAYGGEVARVFRDCCRAADRRGGVPAVLRLWLPALRDLAATALLERLGEGIEVSRAWLVRSGAVAGIVGGMAMLLGALLGFENYALRFTGPFASRPAPPAYVLVAIAAVDQVPSIEWPVIQALGPLGLLLFPLAVMGLQARLAGQGGRVGRLTWLGAGLALLGTLAAPAAYIAFLAREYGGGVQNLSSSRLGTTLIWWGACSSPPE
jgi:hypothetical protein